MIPPESRTASGYLERRCATGVPCVDVYAPLEAADRLDAYGLHDAAHVLRAKARVQRRRCEEVQRLRRDLGWDPR